MTDHHDDVYEALRAKFERLDDELRTQRLLQSLAAQQLVEALDDGAGERALAAIKTEIRVRGVRLVALAEEIDRNLDATSKHLGLSLTTEPR